MTGTIARQMCDPPTTAEETEVLVETGTINLVEITLSEEIVTTTIIHEKDTIAVVPEVNPRAKNFPGRPIQVPETKNRKKEKFSSITRQKKLLLVVLKRQRIAAATAEN